MSIILNKDNFPVAKLAATYKPGACKYAYCVCAEKPATNINHNLVNARAGKITNAKKWDDYKKSHFDNLPFADEINIREFLIGSTDKF